MRRVLIVPPRPTIAFQLTVGWSVGLEYGLGLMNNTMWPSPALPVGFDVFLGAFVAHNRVSIYLPVSYHLCTATTLVSLACQTSFRFLLSQGMPDRTTGVARLCITITQPVTLQSRLR